MDGEILNLTTVDPQPVRELLNDVFRRIRGVSNQDVFTDFPLTFCESNLANCRCIVSGDCAVSHAALWPRECVIGDTRLLAGIIVLVATHPDWRRKGCAARLMRDLQQTMKQNGFDFGMLWTDVPEFYRKLGWQVVRPVGQVVTGLRTAVQRWSPDLPQNTQHLTPFRCEEHLQQVMRIHDCEPVRFTRSVAEAAALLTLPKVEVRVAMQGAKVVAYLAIGRACNKYGLIEYGGTTAGVLWLIVEATQEFDLDDEYPLLILPPYESLADELRQAGVDSTSMESSKGHGYEMIFACRPKRMQSLPPDRLFAWGLDCA